VRILNLIRVAPGDLAAFLDVRGVPSRSFFRSADAVARSLQAAFEAP
jgi:hypothetical protein